MAASIFAVYAIRVPKHDRLLVLSLPGCERERLAKAIGAAPDGSLKTLASLVDSAFWVEASSSSFAESSRSVLARSRSLVLAGDNAPVLDPVSGRSWFVDEVPEFVGSSYGRRTNKRELSNGKLEWPYDGAIDRIYDSAGQLEVGAWSDWLHLSAKGTPLRKGVFKIRSVSEGRYYLSPVLSVGPTPTALGMPIPPPITAGSKDPDRPFLLEFLRAMSTDNVEDLVAELPEDWYFAYVVDPNFALAEAIPAESTLRLAETCEGLERQIQRVSAVGKGSTAVMLICGPASPKGGVSEDGSWLGIAGLRRFSGDLSIDSARLEDAFAYLTSGQGTVDTPSVLRARLNPKQRRQLWQVAAAADIEPLEFERLAELPQPPRKHRLHDD